MPSRVGAARQEDEDDMARPARRMEELEGIFMARNDAGGLEAGCGSASLEVQSFESAMRANDKMRNGLEDMANNFIEDTIRIGESICDQEKR